VHLSDANARYLAAKARNGHSGLGPAVDGLPASAGPQQQVRTWFAAQQSPFVPNSIEVRGNALLIGYPAPTPTGLIAG